MDLKRFQRVVALPVALMSLFAVEQQEVEVDGYDAEPPFGLRTSEALFR